MLELGLLLGGFQGSGIETAMMVLVRALAIAGYGVLAEREYYSNIVGRHSYVLARVSSRGTPRSLRYPVQILAALDPETVFTHFRDLAEGGVLVLNSDELGRRLGEIPSVEDLTRERIRRDLAERGVGEDLASLVDHLRSGLGVRVVAISFRDVLTRVGERRGLSPTQLSRYVSSIVLSAVACTLSLGPRHVEAALRAHFRGREGVVADNLAVCEEVFGRVRGLGVRLELDPPTPRGGRTMVVSGNDAVAMGKALGGLRFQSYYPITPAADESHALERMSYGGPGAPYGPILVLQTEDEIAAIAAAIGAALAGARSSTTTSGPGFDLMVEGLSYAGMNEVPVVITYYQRGGPSTGQPTRGSQSDLLSAIFAGHGEFARVVMSSGDHLEALYDAAEAFNIAERYQLPVIHLLDKFLANSVATVPLPDLSRIRLDRGLLASRLEGYRRFDLGAPVPPRAFLGSAVMWYTGDEHDEWGHISEDPENRERMYRRRVERLELVRRELPRDAKLTVHGSPDADLLLLGWGSVKGVAIDAIEELRARGVEGAYANVRLLWPFPAEEVGELLRSAGEVVLVEHSYGALLGRLISMELGARVEKSVVKYTGRPITLDELLGALDRILSGAESRVVLRHGA